jgi:glucose dehydrogenase
MIAITYMAVTGNSLGRRGPFAHLRYADCHASSSVVALDADTGRRKWHFQFTPSTESQSQASLGVNWKCHALDARTGKLLWKRYLGAAVMASPITYMVDGRQFITVACGHSLFTFALRETGLEP